MAEVQRTAMSAPGPVGSLTSRPTASGESGEYGMKRGWLAGWIERVHSEVGLGIPSPARQETAAGRNAAESEPGTGKPVKEKAMVMRIASDTQIAATVVGGPE